MSLGVMAEKRARKMRVWVLNPGFMQSITSKQMFSPSRSQSNHSTRTSAPLPSAARWWVMNLLVGSLRVGAWKSSTGSMASQFEY